MRSRYCSRWRSRTGSRGQRQTRANRNTAAQRLSARELEVLDWLARGKTNRQIAAILGISWRTVAKHLENAYVKLGVESRVAAVALLLALRAGVTIT
jgi:DNA-binding CsgD family transcriptional regulator